MSKNTTLATNVFATGDPQDVHNIITVGLDLMKPSSDGRTGILKWSDVAAQTQEAIGYARGWLIVRRAYLEVNQASLIVDVKALEAAATKKATDANKLSELDITRSVHAPIIANMKDDLKLSWGEIMCRTGLTEGACRKAYRATDAKKDLGVRNGRGGRFAYDNPTLYRANRKAEGAWIPTTMKAQPTEQDLLNYVAPDAPAAKPAPKARKPKAVKAA